jgi:hypothetical protein
VHVSNPLAAGLAREWIAAGLAVFHGKFITACKYSTVDQEPGGKPVSGGFDAKFIEQGPVYRAGFAPYIALNRKHAHGKTIAI